MQQKQKCYLLLETQIISPSGMVEKMELEARAEWSIKDHSLMIAYQEGIGEQAVLSQLQINLQKKEVLLIRSGAVKFYHVFREGEAAESPYESPYGYMLYASNTKKIQLEMKDGKPHTFILQYDSAFNGEKIGEFTVLHQFVECILPAMDTVH